MPPYFQTVGKQSVLVEMPGISTAEEKEMIHRRILRGLRKGKTSGRFTIEPALYPEFIDQEEFIVKWKIQARPKRYQPGKKKRKRGEDDE